MRSMYFTILFHTSQNYILLTILFHTSQNYILLFSCHSSGLSAYALFVISPVLAEAGVSLSLSGVLDVRVVEEILNTQENLLHSDGWPPVFLLVQDGEANCSGGIHIRVEQWWHKFDFGRSSGEVVFEDDLTLVQPPLPGGPLLSGDPVLPQHQIHSTISILHGPSNVSKRMVFPPALSLLRQPGLGDARHFQKLRSLVEVNQ